MRRRRWEKGASPAAAAAVSRCLSQHCVRRSTEWRKGIEFEGFVAEPMGDHVRVEYSPGPFREVDVIEGGLNRCEEVLGSAGYNVVRTRTEVAVPGGWEPREVLEVRPC